jgi:hypothetical protein
MRGPPPKPASERKRRNHRNEAGQLAVVDGAWTLPAGVKGADGSVIPATLPGKPLRHTQVAYEAFQSSAMARLVTAADVPALHRLFALYDEIERSSRVFARERLVEGATGGTKLNPLGPWIRQCGADARALEDRFGLTPVARLRLGVVFGAAKAGLDALNDALNDDPADDQDQDDPAEDPRRHALDADSRTA